MGDKKNNDDEEEIVLGANWFEKLQKRIFVRVA
jgi:hypothetical protein